MVRRSFRVGLRMGLLLGLIAAFTKLVQALKGPADLAAPGWSPTPAPWTPQVPVPAAEPARAAPTAPAVAKAEVATAPAAKTAPAQTAAPKTASANNVAKIVQWVEPTGDRCPDTHPLKAKLSSKIFQVPGMFAYDRTKPDRCYSDEVTATADGFTKAKK